MGERARVMPTRHYVTYFDHRYLPRAMAMWESLKRHSPGPAHLWALCLSSEAHEALDALQVDGVTAVPLADLERHDPDLLAVKSTRSAVEYYFTCSPALPLYILDKHPEVDLVTYLDADLCFYSSPEALFDELGSASVAITAHRFPPDLAYLEDRGVYNVAWCSFRRDDAGLDVLRTWRRQCLKWCYDRLEDGRYGDQKYLDTWPDQAGVVVLRNPGANVAPWNLRTHRVTYDGQQLRSDGTPIVFYHFSGLKRDGRWSYDLNLHIYGVAPDDTVLGRLYRPYIADLVRHSAAVAVVVPLDAQDSVRGGVQKRSFARARAREVRSLVNVVRRRSMLAR